MSRKFECVEWMYRKFECVLSLLCMFWKGECVLWLYGEGDCVFWMYWKNLCECIERMNVHCGCMGRMHASVYKGCMHFVNAYVERMHVNVYCRKDECVLWIYRKYACECIERMNEHCECMGRVHDSGNLPYARQQGLSSHAVLRLEMRRNVSFRVFAKMFKQQILSASSKVWRKYDF